MRISITRIILLLMLICAVNRDTILHHDSERQEMPSSVIPFCVAMWITGEWRKLHSGELSDLYSSPNIIPVIKRWRIRQAEHVPGVGGTVPTGVCWRHLKELHQLKDLVVNGRSIINLSERRFWGSVVIWFRLAQVPCDHGNELPGSVKCWGLPD